MEKEIILKEVEDGYQISVKGHNKLQGNRVRTNSQLEDMVQLVGEVVLGYKIGIVRK